jgi:probable addiction module antidote protein
MKKNTTINPDYEISKEDFNTTYAKILSKNPKELKAFKKAIVDDFNKTKELTVLLENLKIIAKAEGIMELAQKTRMKRTNIYRFLSKDNNPTFANLFLIAHSLGIDFKLQVA